MRARRFTSASSLETKPETAPSKAAQRTSALPEGALPRGMRPAVAAAYVGLSVSMFYKMVEDGRLPKPAHFGRIAIWDRRQLDRFLDAAFEAADDDDIWNHVA